MIEKYLNIIQNNVNLEDGQQKIVNMLINIYENEGISNKELARMNLLPIPIVVAIKKELKKLLIVKQDNGIRLTTEGKCLLEDELGLSGLNHKLYKQLKNNNSDDVILVLKDLLEDIYLHRPTADVTLDQTKCTIETSINRAILCLKNGSLIGNKILCIGDDDLVSIALGFLLKLLYRDMADCKTSIHVLDIDTRILDYISDIAKKDNLPIICSHQDLRKPIPNNYLKKFDCFFTDPPYTLNGMNLFLSRGIDALKGKIGLNIFLSYSHKSLSFIYEMQKVFIQMGLMLSEILPSFNTYEGAGIIGNKGQMIILKTTTCTKNLIQKTFQQPIYTDETKKSIRIYQCKTCNSLIKVGQTEKFNTIEDLKRAGCSFCHQQVFKRK